MFFPNFFSEEQVQFPMNFAEIHWIEKTLRYLNQIVYSPHSQVIPSNLMPQFSSHSGGLDASDKHVRSKSGFSAK